MKNTISSFLKLSIGFLILLWTYAALSKLLALRQFVWAMHNQAIPSALATALVYLLPPVEIIIALLLITEKYRKPGLQVSFILLLIFTGYISLVLLNFFGMVPCSCGGILEQMSWITHLVFNLFCLTINLISILTIKRKEEVTFNTI